jgi:hypothetical protein
MNNILKHIIGVFTRVFLPSSISSNNTCNYRIQTHIGTNMTNFLFDNMLKAIRTIFDTRTEEERYLSDAKDIHDLEYRLKQIQRGHLNRQQSYYF